MHLGTFGKLAQRIVALVARGHTIQLLHGYNLGISPIDNIGTTVVIELEIQAFAVADIVAHDS